MLQLSKYWAYAKRTPRTAINAFLSSKFFFYQQSQPGSLVSVSFPRGHHDRPGRGLSPGGIWGWRVRWAWLILQALWLDHLKIKRFTGTVSDISWLPFGGNRMCRTRYAPPSCRQRVSDLRSGLPTHRQCSFSFIKWSQPGSFASVAFPRGHHDRPGRGLSPGRIWGWRVRWAWLILQALWLNCLTIKRSDLLERFFDT